MLLRSFTMVFFYLVLELPSYAQSTQEILLEKTIYLNQERSFGDNKWYNEGFIINLADFKELNNQASIQSLSYWIGFNEKGLKAKSKAQKIKKILMNGQKTQTKTYSGELDLFILRDYADSSQYDCQEKFLNGGFIVYRIDSDCYCHQQNFEGETFGQAKLDSKGSKMSTKRLVLVLRSRQKIENPVFVKVVINLTSKE
jgi:hypothetical protein